MQADEPVITLYAPCLHNLHWPVTLSLVDPLGQIKQIVVSSLTVLTWVFGQVHLSIPTLPCAEVDKAGHLAHSNSLMSFTFW